MLTDGPFVGSDFTPEDFTEISIILMEAGGVLLDHYNDACVKRRIAARIRELQLPGANAYIALLRVDCDEVQRLSGLISLHVSTFYRDPTTFAALRKFLNKGLQSHPSPQPHRWWSAGCAGGEEPFSLALIAAQVPESLSGVEILATDVSPKIIEQAENGYFDPSRLNNVPREERTRFFNDEAGGCRIEKKFRSMVRFVQHDLLTEAPYPRAELILCRYVLIYFNPADQEEVVRRFAEALPSGGLLVLGRTESLRDKGGNFTLIDAAERIYRRL